jgi:ATP-dependent DNA helicase RecG
LELSQNEIEKILLNCLKPASIQSLMDIFNWKDRTKFRNKFIKPLLAEELLQMTIPDKPNSPKQKYVTTEQGMMLLKNKENEKDG